MSGCSGRGAGRRCDGRRHSCSAGRDERAAHQPRLRCCRPARRPARGHPRRAAGPAGCPARRRPASARACRSCHLPGLAGRAHVRYDRVGFRGHGHVHRRSRGPARVRRPGPPRGRVADRGSGRRRRRRDRSPRAERFRGLLRPARRNGRGARVRRLVSDRRPRLTRRPRVSVGGGSAVGPDRLGRGKRLPGRGRGGSGEPSRRGRRRSNTSPRFTVGRCARRRGRDPYRGDGH